MRTGLSPRLWFIAPTLVVGLLSFGITTHLAAQDIVPDSAAATMDPVSYTSGPPETTCAPGCQACACKCSGPATRPNPCATSHKPLFYDNNFSYLSDPASNAHCLGDCLKLMPVGPCGNCGTLDIGGQVRFRYHHERGMGQQAGATRFEATDNDFGLTRLRLYSNWQVNDWLRVYTEGIFAEVTADSAYVPRPIDQNSGDFLNAFIDVNLTDTLGVRMGRQELLYGNQRLISPLDWANTRRTFEGAKLMLRSGDWAVDGFYTHYVPVRPFELDEADYKQPFYGLYGAYSGFEHFTVESYYIGYDNRNAGSVTSNFSLHTFGGRINGSYDDWLFELEGGPQLGRQVGLNLDQQAYFGTVGLGRKLDRVTPWPVSLWFYYDYASGDATGGDFNRFNQLFPLAHKYLGYIDAVQRSNIEAPNVLLTMNPTERIQVLFWYWHFMSNQADDIVPAIGGTPQQSRGSRDLGDELDVLVTYKFGPRSNILFGWSHFWRGNKIEAPEDADFFYSQYLLNY